MNRVTPSRAAWPLIVLLAASAGCAEGAATDPPPAGLFHFPVAVGVHPAGYALVVNSNFDAQYSSGSVQLVDLNALAQRIEQGTAMDSDNSDLILADAATAIPSFAGDVIVSGDGDSGLALITSRQSSELLVLKLDFSGPDPVVSCSDTPRRDGELARCEGSRYVLAVSPSDPYSLLVAERAAATDGSVNVWLGYLRSGTIDEVEIPDGWPEEGLPSVVRSVETGSGGTGGLAYSASSGYVFASSRLNALRSNPIYYFENIASDTPAVGTYDLFGIVLGNQTRGLATSPDGYVLAVAVHDPDLLVFLDVSSNSKGKPAMRILGSVKLEGDPAQVLWAGRLVLVSDAKNDTLAAVDSDTIELVELSDGICRGPHSMALWPGYGGWLLVGCFEQDQLVVVDIDPASASFFQVLARVGKEREEH
ncbi:MAG: hypothetical protein D6806_03480 [Deltaproteobacteria bacterium]|nr:MAG: hypothetical protein D6806_03480 [Deltaproteobacteria bacterium]